MPASSTAPRHPVVRASTSVLTAAWIATWAVACGHVGERPSTAPPLSDVVVIGQFSDRHLVEASGLLVSTHEPNVFWAQNDSGNDPQLFAVDSTGRALGTVRVAGATNRDWEAIAPGPCDTGACVYIGDVGDNQARRDDLRIWRVPEPRSTDSVTAPAVALAFRYADGPKDVEAMWITPDTTLYLLTKRGHADASGHPTAARLYRLLASAWRAESPVVATFVDSLPIIPDLRDGGTWITDAALSPPDAEGTRQLAVRTYNDEFVFGVNATTWTPSDLIARCSLAALRERKSGEGVTWFRAGQLMFDAEGERALLHTGRCLPETKP